MPKSVKIVKKISLGHEHLVALVEMEGFLSHPEAIWGMGSNLHGQLGKDPFRHDFIENLVQIRPKIIHNVKICISQIECGAHHTIFLARDLSN